MLPKKGERVRVTACGKGAQQLRVGEELVLHSDAVQSNTRGKIIFCYVTSGGRIRSSGAVAVERVERTAVEES